MASYRMIDGLIFKLFDVFGEYLPTDEMIEDVLKDRLTDEAKQQFCAISNKYCLEFRIDFLSKVLPHTPVNEFEKERIEIDRLFMGCKQDMCAITGHSFEKIVRYLYVMKWYQAIDGNSSGGNPQSIRKGNIPLNVNRKGEMERDKLSLKYLDFREADDYIREFYESVASSCKAGNVEMINLLKVQYVIFKERAGLEEKIRKNGLKITDFFCKYCQQYHKFYSFKVRDNCGSKECKRGADAERKIPKDRKGWEKDLSIRPKKCSECESTRSYLNRDRLCEVCYLRLKDTLV